MAQVVVDSRVMRDKARTIENAAVTIQTLYAEMLQEVTATTNRMKGEAIETAKERFASMQNVFDTIVKDIKAYSAFLNQAAEGYEAAEREGTQKAAEQGYESAQYNLGNCYKTGNGVEVNLVKAAEWYRRNSELFLRGESTGRIFTYAKDLCEFSGIGANRNRVRNGCL